MADPTNLLSEPSQVVAESVLKSLSPARSTYYTPVSVATVALCWVTNQLYGYMWWLVCGVLLIAITVLIFKARTAETKLRGSTQSDELRLARTIALSSAFITLVAAAGSVSGSPQIAGIHVGSCTLEIVLFLWWTTRQREHVARPPVRVNVVQLTLILAVLLGGAAYSSASYVNYTQGYKDTSQAYKGKFKEYQQSMKECPLKGYQDCSDVYAGDLGRANELKEEALAMKEFAGHFDAMLASFYTLWFIAGLLLVRAQLGASRKDA